jgi:hypothetical protein
MGPPYPIRYQVFCSSTVDSNFLHNVIARRPGSGSRLGNIVYVPDVDEEEAIQYLSNAGLGSEAQRIYKLVGGRMAHLVSAVRYYDRATQASSKFEGMSIYIVPRNRADRLLSPQTYAMCYFVRPMLMSSMMGWTASVDMVRLQSSLQRHSLNKGPSPGLRLKIWYTGTKRL